MPTQEYTSPLEPLLHRLSEEFIDDRDLSARLQRLFKESERGQENKSDRKKPRSTPFVDGGRGGPGGEGWRAGRTAGWDKKGG